MIYCTSQASTAEQSPELDIATQLTIAVLCLQSNTIDDLLFSSAFKQCPDKEQILQELLNTALTMDESDQQRSIAIQLSQHQVNVSAAANKSMTRSTANVWQNNDATTAQSSSSYQASTLATQEPAYNFRDVDETQLKITLHNKELRQNISFLDALLQQKPDLFDQKFVDLALLDAVTSNNKEVVQFYVRNLGHMLNTETAITIVENVCKTSTSLEQIESAQHILTTLHQAADIHLAHQCYMKDLTQRPPFGPGITQRFPQSPSFSSNSLDWGAMAEAAKAQARADLVEDFGEAFFDQNPPTKPPRSSNPQGPLNPYDVDAVTNALEDLEDEDNLEDEEAALNRALALSLEP